MRVTVDLTLSQPVERVSDSGERKSAGVTVIGVHDVLRGMSAVHAFKLSEAASSQRSQESFNAPEPLA